MITVDPQTPRLATITGIGAVPIPDPKAREDMPNEAHPLQEVGKQLGLDYAKAEVFRQAMGGRDSAFRAHQLKDANDATLEALRPAMAAVTEAQKSLADTNLKPEVAKQRAANLVTAGASVLGATLPGVLKKTETVLDSAEKLADAALAPDIPEGGEAAAAVRAREIRDRLEVMDPAKRSAALLSAAKAGKVETIHAVADDPFGVGLVDPATLASARQEALRSLGHGWVADNLTEARNNHEALAARLDFIVNAVPAAFGLRRPEGTPVFSKQATERVAAGKKRINL
jgi:hypothetical protein